MCSCREKGKGWVVEKSKEGEDDREKKKRKSAIKGIRRSKGATTCMKPCYTVRAGNVIWDINNMFTFVNKMICFTFSWLLVLVTPVKGWLFPVEHYSLCALHWFSLHFLSFEVPSLNVICYSLSHWLLTCKTVQESFSHWLYTDLSLLDPF